MNTQKKSQAIDAFRTAIAEVAPTIPLVLFVTLREQMDAALGSQELITLLANFFGLLAKRSASSCGVWPSAGLPSFSPPASS